MWATSNSKALYYQWVEFTLQDLHDPSKPPLTFIIKLNSEDHIKIEITSQNPSSFTSKLAPFLYNFEAKFGECYN